MALETPFVVIQTLRDAGYDDIADLVERRELTAQSGIFTSAAMKLRDHLIQLGHNDLAEELYQREHSGEVDVKYKAGPLSEDERLRTPLEQGYATPDNPPMQGYAPSVTNHDAAIDLDQPSLLSSIAHEKPSKQHKADLYVLRLFRQSGGDCQIYEDVKHCWWSADNSVLVIVQYTNPERTAWRNITWLRERIDWYTFTHAEFE